MTSKLIRTSFAAAALAALSVSAQAADMVAPAYTKGPVAAPAWSWSGFYIGVQGGGAWGTTEDSATSFVNCFGGVCLPRQTFTPVGAERSSYTMNGFHGGGTAGFNWQFGQVVAGVEGDISGANIEGTGDCALGYAFNLGTGHLPAGCSTKMPWFGTLTGRLGVTIDHALVFVKGGGAWAHFDRSVTLGLVANGPGALQGDGSFGENRSGFTVGTGIEYALGSNWSAKVEYDYMDFGTKSSVVSTTGTLFGAGNVNNLTVDVRERVHVVRAGLNYRFGWWN